MIHPELGVRCGAWQLLPQQRTESHLPSHPGRPFVLYVAFVRIILYCIAGRHYGYFRDELYYLACGGHPAWDMLTSHR